MLRYCKLIMAFCEVLRLTKLEVEKEGRPGKVGHNSKMRLTTDH